MAKQIINIGRTANDRSGDPLRTAFSKVNDNFTELYSAIGADAPANQLVNGEWTVSLGADGVLSAGTINFGGTLKTGSQSYYQFEELVTGEGEGTVYYSKLTLPNIPEIFGGESLSLVTWGSELAIKVRNPSDFFNDYTWSFNNNGSLTIPSNGAGLVWNNPDTPPFPIGGWLANSTIAFDKDLGIVLSNGVGGIGGYSWILGKDGKLKLPASGTFNNTSTASSPTGTIYTFTLDADGNASGIDNVNEVWLPTNAESISIQTGWIITFNNGQQKTVVNSVAGIMPPHMAQHQLTWTGNITLTSADVWPLTVQSADYNAGLNITKLEITPEGTTTWTFDSNGVIKLPASGDIVDSTGASVIGAPTVIDGGNASTTF